MRRCARVMLVCLLLAPLAARSGSGARAAESDAGAAGQSSGPTWHIQRLLVPADRPEDWPRDKTERYLPMPAEEFEQRLAHLRHPASQTAEIPSARLAAADYTATLSGNDLVDGEAVWQFESRGKEKTVVVLEGCRLPLSDARWLDSPQRAVVGNDQSGRLAVVVERPGKLRCDWSLRGRQDSAENLNFDLQLPACPISTLHLTLPAELAAQVDRGLAAPAGPPQRGQQRWTIELGGNHRVQLQIAKRHPPEADRPLALVQSSQVFDLSQRGLELSSEFRLNVVGGALRRLSLLFDQPLAPVRAQIGEVEVPLTLTAGDGKDPVRAEIEFPEPLSGSGNLLRITAVAPVTWNARWRLPIVHLPQAHWQEGEAMVRVVAPLVLDDLLCTGCRQTKVEPLGDPPAGEAVGIQCFGDSPQIEVIVSRRQEHIRLASGVSIALRAGECAGRCVADFTALEGERFTLEAEVAPQWIIDNVESDPPGRVVDWSHEALPGKPGNLKLQLRTPLSPQHDLRLQVDGRRRRAPLSERLRQADLEILTFTDVEANRRLIHLHAVDPYQLQFSGAESLHYLDAAQLAPADAAVLEENPAGVVFVDDRQSRAMSVSLSTRPPRYQADVHAEVVAGNDSLTESYRFSVVPQKREMGRVIVRFSQPRAEPITWSIDGVAAAALRTRRLSEPEQAALGLVEGEAWEVVLATPRSTPFEIQAVRELPLRGETPVALAALVGAESQRGSVLVRSTGSAAPELRSRRLPALPLEMPPTGQQSTLLAAFRYEPEEDTLQVAEPPLVLVPRDELAAANPAWIWQAHLDSRYQRGGAEHLLTCRVENTGRGRIEFRLPADAQLRGAWIDEQPSAASLADDKTRCQISLPPGNRFVTVTLQWTDESGACRRTISSSAAPWPDCDLPILARQWTVSLPLGFVVAEAQIGGRSAITVPWTARLFGPLARLPEAPAFNSTSSNSGLLSPAAQPSANHNHTQRSGDEARTDDSTANQQKAHKPAGLLSPWKPAGRNSSPENAGWTTYQFDESADAPGHIWVVDQHSLAAWSWAVFVLVVGIGWWLGRGQLLLTAVIVGAVAAVALVVPAAWAPIIAAAWLGFIAGQFSARLWRPGPSAVAVNADASESTSKTKRLAPAATAICWFALFLAAHKGVQADEPIAAPAPPRTSDIRQVLIPVDKDQHPTGGLYYLPESFHGELVRATADAKFASPQYLITQAMYRAQIGRDAATGDLTSGDWQATFDIESLTERAAMQFPFDSLGAALVPDGIKLEGQGALFHWDQQQRWLAIELGGLGRRRVEVLLRPQRQRGGFDFAIPAVANSQVDLTTSAAAVLELESALGAPSRTSATEPRSAPAKGVAESLGPAQQMVVRPLELASSAGSAKAPAFDVDELYWLRVRPGAVTIDGRYRIKVREGQVQRLHLLADSRLRPLGAASGGAIKIRRVSDEVNALTIDLPPTAASEKSIDVSFLLDGAKGIGEVQLPRLQVEGAAAARRWWAASIDSALEMTEAPASGGQALPPAQFTALWGADDVKPQIALERTAAGADWSLTTRPRETRLSARCRLALNVGEESVGVRLAANVTAQGGQVFQYRLSVPAALQIDDLAAYEQHGQRPAHWARSGDNLLTIMLAAPSTGEIKLLARGRLPRSSAAKFPLPEFGIQGSANEKFRAVVTRTTDVLAEVIDPAGLKTVPPGEVAAALAEAEHDGLIEHLRPGEEQLVAILDGPKESQPAVLRIEPNRPRVRTAQATSISRSADAWQAAVDLSLLVEEGALDVLRFELPPQWSGSFKITPPMPFTVSELPGLNRRQLVLFPETPLSGTTNLHITGPLAVAGGERPAAPDVYLVGAPRSSRYFLLPRRIENQQLSWDTRGLIPKPLPEELAAIVSDAASYRSYQLLGSRYRAVLRSAERSAEDPQVRLADISTSFESGERCWGVAAFDVVPAGATNCLLEMPDGFQVVHALLDGAAAQRTVQGENRWNIWLGDNKLPRRLEVLFTGQRSSPAGQIQSLQAPLLADIPVERTLWSVSAPQSFGGGAPPKGTSISEMRHELLRYESTTTLADSAAGLLLEESSDNLLHWYAPWGKRFLDCRAALHRLLSAGAGDSSVPNAAEEVATIEQDQARLSRRLGTSNLMSQMASEPAIASGPLRLWSLAQLPGRSLAFALIRGDGGAVSVDYAQRSADDRWARFLVAGAILLAVVALAIARRRRWFNSLFQWQQFPLGPHALGVFAAVVWWLWLTPRFVALLILAASVYAIVRHIGAFRASAARPAFAMPSRTISNPGSSRGRF